MFKPKYLKQARLLQKGVKKFLKYKEDVLANEQRAKIDEASTAFDQAVEARDKELVKNTAKELTKVCEKAVPIHKNTALRENVEVIFVAFVIAIGIRSYFLQPFKIPTGSMQPTLNGVKATSLSDDPDFVRPNVINRAFSKVVNGRSWVDATMKKDGYLRSVGEETLFKFFTYTKFRFEDSSQNFSIPAPFDVVMNKSTRKDGFGVVERLFPEVRPGPSQRLLEFRQPRLIPKGTVFARGKIDTGDQVLVDKFSYHFRRPNRGEVFVFNTRSINGIRNYADRNQPSQHYIKRLAGVPGDRIELRPLPVASDGHRKADLIVNGEKGTEPGFVRVDQDYGGYVYAGRQNSFDLRDGESGWRVYKERPYVALGDNSRNSSDSRVWGVIPEENLVGPALMVYWPFGAHWGPIN